MSREGYSQTGHRMPNTFLLFLLPSWASMSLVWLVLHGKLLSSFFLKEKTQLPGEDNILVTARREFPFLLAAVNKICLLPPGAFLKKETRTRSWGMKRRRHLQHARPLSSTSLVWPVLRCLSLHQELSPQAGTGTASSIP